MPPEFDSLARALMLAGHTTAHAIWSISDGSALIPIFAWERADQRGLDRLVAADSAAALAAGEERMAADRESGVAAVLVVDVYLRDQGGERRDALQVIIRDRVGEAQLTMLVPYRSAASAAGFAVNPPIFTDDLGRDREVMITWFYGGVVEHPQGSVTWKQHFRR